MKWPAVSGENHGHGDEPAVEGVGPAEGGSAQGYRKKGEQGGHVHGGHSNRVDHVVEPFAGEGRTRRCANYLAVGGVRP